MSEQMNGKVNGLMSGLELMQGKRVTVDVVGAISTQVFFDEFECWVDGDKIVLSETDDEKYFYIGVDEIDGIDWTECGKLLQVDIKFKNGMEIMIYNN